MPSRALQTWQMMLELWLTSLIRCCSPNPIFAKPRLNVRRGGQFLDAHKLAGLDATERAKLRPAHSPSRTLNVGFRLLTVRQE